MATSVVLSAGVRDTLLALKGTNELISRTNARLSSGLKVAGVLDDPKIFFEAKVLSDRASDFADKKDGIDQGVSSLSAALEAVEAIDSYVRQAKGIALAAKTATGTELTTLITQYNEVLTQIDNLAADASYQGLNMVNGTGSTLKVEFSDKTASILSVNSVDITTSSLGINLTSAANGTAGGNNFATVAGIDAAIAEIDAALTELRGNAKSLGSNVSILQTRLDFSEKYAGVLDEGAGKLTLADVTEEGASLVALQTRQQLGISALAFAGQSEQQILALFR